MPLTHLARSHSFYALILHGLLSVKHSPSLILLTPGQSISLFYNCKVLGGLEV